MSGQIPGETPLDFLTKNLRQPIKVIEPQDVLNKVDAERAAAEAAKTQPKPEIPFDIHPEKQSTSPPAFEPNKEGSEDAKSLGADGDEGNVPAASGDFKRLRTALKDANKTLAETKIEKEKLATQVKKYETGEAFPDILQEKENEIAKLSQYEKLVSLKTSRAYQEAYIKPLSTLRSKFVEYGKEYGVPEDVMNQALNLKNPRELDSFLEDHFTTLCRS